MLLSGVVLLASQSARSQAYIQALIANDLYPEHVILLGKDQPIKNPNSSAQGRYKEIFLPNLSEPVSVSCERAGIPLTYSDVCDVNSEEVISYITNLAPKIIIYSGVGGQIVSDKVLQLGAKFLHFHSGWLPEYRGSTTLYYALLNGELPGVTALFLDKSIDTGPVLERKHYPIPPADIDLDQVYDSSIRADLLVQVMRNYTLNKSFRQIEDQDPNTGTTYFVIHPVLKHLAILSLPHNTA